MIHNRAWSRFTIKSTNDELREFSGIASTPSLDHMGDRISSEGVIYSLPMPLLWQHDANRPVGSVVAAEVTREGITVRARIAKVSEPPALRDRLDTAWAEIKSRLVRGLSIGFRVLAERPIDGGSQITSWRWLELSCVTIPANEDCSIANIRSADLRGRGAVRLDPAAARRAEENRLRREIQELDREIHRRVTLQHFSALE